jgi:hypothetical protein
MTAISYVAADHQIWPDPSRSCMVQTWHKMFQDRESWEVHFTFACFNVCVFPFGLLGYRRMLHIMPIWFVFVDFGVLWAASTAAELLLLTDCVHTFPDQKSPMRNISGLVTLCTTSNDQFSQCSCLQFLSVLCGPALHFGNVPVPWGSLGLFTLEGLGNLMVPLLFGWDHGKIHGPWLKGLCSWCNLNLDQKNGLCAFF